MLGADQTPEQGPPSGVGYPADGTAVPRPRYVEAPVARPLATYAILGLTILVYLGQQASVYFLGADLPAALGMKVNNAILQGQLWRLLTPMLLHGSLLHVAFNMYALNALGRPVEAHYGHTRFLALYVLGGFAGNVISFLLTPENSLGSSTAIFGLISAYGIFLYQNRGLFGSRARGGLINIVVIALINLAIGTAPGIDNWGHVGGLLGGGLFAWLGGPLLKVELAYPAVRVEDKREAGEVVRAGIIDLLVFGGILAVALLRG